MPPANRKRIMLKLAELMMKNRDELALLETLDMGKPIAYSTRVDIPGSANTVQWFAEAIDKIYDEVAPTPGNVVAMITREPVGRGGRRGAVELPAADGVLEDQPGARRRQLGDPEARRAVAAHRHSARRARSRGRHPRGRVQRAAGLRRDRGPGARPPHGCRRARLHRLDRGRQVLPEVLRRSRT